MSTHPRSRCRRPAGGIKRLRARRLAVLADIPLLPIRKQSVRWPPRLFEERLFHTRP